MLQCNINCAILNTGIKPTQGAPMFFFFPFYAESQANGSGSSHAKTLPLLPAPGSARTSSRATDRAWDFGDFGVDLLRKVISAFTSSLTALGNRANALFAQLTAALAFDRVARDTVTFINSAFSGFGLPSGGRPSPFGAFRASPTQDPMSFSPFLQGFNPLAHKSMGRRCGGHELLDEHVDACRATAQPLLIRQQYTRFTIHDEGLDAGRIFLGFLLGLVIPDGRLRGGHHESPT